MMNHAYGYGLPVPPLTPLAARIGQARPTPTRAQTEQQQAEAFTIANVARAITQVTPTLVIVGIATGASFAIGSYLVSRYVTGNAPKTRGRR